MQELQEYIGKKVVVDTKSSYIYLGTLVSEETDYMTIQDVDVHDHSATLISKDLYIIEAIKYGIKINRKQVKLMRKEIVSISLLDDIVIF
ncbi:MAG: hypothetical protein HUU50_18550 [Candidatus Brocadiae bacterium]|nr:hypothetical protein [Candidatus Brocadiia bacterium]